MKSYLSIATFAIALNLCVSCADSHFIGDDTERATVEADFAARRDSVPCRHFFDAIDMMEISDTQCEALQFL